MWEPRPVSAFRGKPPANVLMNALGLMTSLPWSPATRGLYCTQVIRPKAFMRTLAGLASSADWLAYCIKTKVCSHVNNVMLIFHASVFTT